MTKGHVGSGTQVKDEAIEPKSGNQTPVKALLVLPILCLVCALALAASYHASKDRIALQKQRALLQALTEIFPASSYNNDVLEAEFALPDSLQQQLNLPSDSKGFRLEKDGNVSGIILPSVSLSGYSGPIHLIVGLRSTRPLSVQAVRVTDHSETPGLGDKMMLSVSNWIKAFADTSLQSPPQDQWAVVPHGGVFDAFTGATITPAAIVQQVALTLEAAEKHRTALFTHSPVLHLDESSLSLQALPANMREP